ncbi:MAG TPA: hypothetical protein VGB66_18380, partial [Longimicrobium sp.]
MTLRELEKGPGKAEVDTGGGATVTVGVSREAFSSMLRTMLTAPSVAVQVPWIISRSARGDYAPAAKMIYTLRRSAPATVSHGFQLSVLCTEDLPRIRDAD